MSKVSLLRSTKYDRSGFSRDREKLLAAATIMNCRLYARPADALHAVAKVFGYEIAYRELPGEQNLGKYDGINRKIWVCKNLRKKIPWPGAAGVEEIWVIAHELAHLRLHSPRLSRGLKVGRTEEAEANLYARTFLIPRRQLVQLPEFKELLPGLTLEQINDRVYAMADHFGVAGHKIQQELVDMGLAKMDWPNKSMEVLAG